LTSNLLYHERRERERREEGREREKVDSCQEWWCTPVMPAFGRLGQKDNEFQASLGYIDRSQK
jgi:hypothetical protein